LPKIGTQPTNEHYQQQSTTTVMRGSIALLLVATIVVCLSGLHAVNAACGIDSIDLTGLKAST
jgi:hypothetical protein